jgi:hypothetical protein
MPTAAYCHIAVLKCRFVAFFDFSVSQVAFNSDRLRVGCTLRCHPFCQREDKVNIFPSCSHSIYFNWAPDHSGEKEGPINDFNFIEIRIALSRHQDAGLVVLEFLE